MLILMLLLGAKAKEDTIALLAVIAETTVATLNFILEFFLIFDIRLID